MEERNELIIHFDELEEGDHMYESESTGDEFFVASLVGSANRDGYWSIMRHEKSTDTYHWVHAPRRTSYIAATADLDRMAKRDDNDWGEVYA